MRGSLGRRGLLAVGAVALATLLGGCVYDPYPGGGYYAGPYGGGVVADGGGWHESWHHGWHRHNHDDDDWRR